MVNLESDVRGSHTAICIRVGRSSVRKSGKTPSVFEQSAMFYSLKIMFFQMTGHASLTSGG